MQGTAVSKTIHRHTASKLASADEFAFDSPLGYSVQKRENMENLRGDVYSLHITHRRSLLVTSDGDRWVADSRRLFRWR